MRFSFFRKTTITTIMLNATSLCSTHNSKKSMSIRTPHTFFHLIIAITAPRPNENAFAYVCAYTWITFHFTHFSSNFCSIFFSLHVVLNTGPIITSAILLFGIRGAVSTQGAFATCWQPALCSSDPEPKAIWQAMEKSRTQRKIPKANMVLYLALNTLWSISDTQPFVYDRPKRVT